MGVRKIRAAGEFTHTVTADRNIGKMEIAVQAESLFTVRAGPVSQLREWLIFCLLLPILLFF